MPRKPDMHNIRERTVWRNGQRVKVYQARVRLKDEHGTDHAYTRTFDKREDAQNWRARKRLAVRDGQEGLKREKLREYAAITVVNRSGFAGGSNS